MPVRRDLGRLNEEFEAFLLGLQFRAEETEMTPERRRARRAQADRSALDFAKVYYPNIFTAPFSRLHRHIAQLEQGRYTISGFPKSGKTAFTYVGRVVRHIATGGGGLSGIALRTIEAARQRTSALSRIIQRNRILAYDYDLEVMQSASGWHIFKSSGGQTQLVAGSVNTGLRYHIDDTFGRFALLVADDVYDRETSRSSLDNERVEGWVTGEAWRQLEDDGLFILLGNAISVDCPVVRLRRRFAEQHFSFPVVDGGGRPTWPEVYGPEAVARMEAENDTGVWHGEYLDDPLEIGGTFDPAWLRFTRVRPEEITASITAIDPARGESPSACYKGVFTLGITPGGGTRALDVYLRQESYPLMFDYLARLRRRVPGHRAFLFEDDFAQWQLAQPYYLQWLLDHPNEPPLAIIPFCSKALGQGAKDSRILTLVHPHQTGVMQYDERLKGSPDYERYRRQYLAFGRHTSKLDGLDAAASAHILIRRFVETGSFTPVVERRWKQPAWMTGGFH